MAVLEYVSRRNYSKLLPWYGSWLCANVLEVSATRTGFCGQTENQGFGWSTSWQSLYARRLESLHREGMFSVYVGLAVVRGCILHVSYLSLSLRGLLRRKKTDCDFLPQSVSGSWDFSVEKVVTGWSHWSLWIRLLKLLYMSWTKGHVLNRDDWKYSTPRGVHSSPEALTFVSDWG